MASETEDQTVETPGADNDGGRQRSTIAFPYGGLDDALAVAKTLSEHGGLGELASIAAWLDHDNVDSGTFRLKIAAARIFGLIEVKEERASLTDLGNQIVRPENEARALAMAFLTVPLYRKIYEKYKGRLLPGSAVLEADMVELGVAPKQKARARQGLQRAAELAKLGKDRLVLPGGVSLDSKPQDEGKGRLMGTSQEQQRLMGRGAEINPAIVAFIEELPPDGEWTQMERDYWARIFLRTLDKFYKIKDS